MNRLRILLTGAGGFVGQHIYNSLSKQFDVIPLDRRGIPSCDAFINLDLCDKEAAVDYFADFQNRNKIDVIIHLASRLVSAEETEKMTILHENLHITESLIAICKILMPIKIINFSSMAVYPNKTGRYSEISEIRTSDNTECLYGLSKFMSENLIDFFLKKLNINIAHLRIAQIYGTGMRNDRIIPIMIEELKNSNTITVLGNGERESNFISIEKLVAWVLFFVNTNHTGIYNIGDEQMTYLELAQKYISLLGNNESRIILINEGSREKFILDLSKAESLYDKNEGLV